MNKKHDLLLIIAAVVLGIIILLFGPATIMAFAKFEISAGVVGIFFTAGSDVFKVDMTRRLEPMDRVKELSSASVPFSFDVHSLIFSDDAVGLENTLHKELNSRRVNKINLRKEFFRVSMDELEALVYKHDPAAEFNRTMLAEEYNQGLSLTEPVMELSEDEFEEE